MNIISYIMILTSNVGNSFNISDTTKIISASGIRVDNTFVTISKAHSVSSLGWQPCIFLSR